MIKNHLIQGIIASLDMESLVTNIPVDETIEVILDWVYRDDHDKKLDIPEESPKTPPNMC